MLNALTVIAAVEGEESSKTLFYIAGALLVAFAIVIAALGITRIGTFPSGRGQTRGVIGLAALLVAFAMAAAVITA